jgi:UDP-glucose 4-epimerase
MEQHPPAHKHPPLNILITGGCGFIGSNLARHLRAKGHKVTVFDNLSADTKNLPKEVAVIKGDIRERDAVEKAVAGQEYVVHLAAEVSVPRTMEHPELAEQVNVIGTINVLRAAKSAGVKKVVLASSAAVYGNEPHTPTKESERPQPMSPYAISKLALEDYAAFYRAQGLESCCLRFFNVYGPGQLPGTYYAAVIPAFIRKALDGEPLTIFGDGEQTRDFVYVDDVARAIEAALRKGSGVYNVATGKSVSINALAQEIAAATRTQSGASRIEHKPARAGDPRTSLADVSNAKEELGFEAKTQLKDGLRKTVEFFRNKK